MAVTIAVCQGAEEGEAPLTITLDAPRIVLGRGEGCEVRLPDPSVSHRHASLRQKGGEYVIVDEGSSNGTWLGSVALPPHTPRVVASGERVRLGRVWIEIRFEPAVVKGSTAAAAKELALALVRRALHDANEPSSARLACVSGPDRGVSMEIDEAGIDLVVGRAHDAAMRLSSERAARRHASVSRRGEALFVRDLGGGVAIDGVVLREGSLREGQELALGDDLFDFTFPAAAALAEIERSPDERVRPADAPPPPMLVAAAPPPSEALHDPTPPPPTFEPTPSPPPAHLARRGGWSPADVTVIVLALGVLVASAAGGFLLLR